MSYSQKYTGSLDQSLPGVIFSQRVSKPYSSSTSAHGLSDHFGVAGEGTVEYHGLSIFHWNNLLHFTRRVYDGGGVHLRIGQLPDAEACHLMTRSNLLQRGLLGMALLCGIGAAGSEPAAGLGLHRRGQLSLHDNPLPMDVQTGDGNGGQQTLGIGVQRAVKELVCLTFFHHCARYITRISLEMCLTTDRSWVMKM